MFLLSLSFLCAVCVTLTASFSMCGASRFFTEHNHGP